MGHKKHKRSRKHQPSAITDCQQQRKKARSLGYRDVEEYEKGLSVVKRLLAKKKVSNKADTVNK